MADLVDVPTKPPASSFTATMLGLAAVMLGSGLTIGTLLFKGRPTPLPVQANPLKQKYTVQWVNPDTKRWEPYQTGMTLRRANKLAYRVKHTINWFTHNPATRVVLDGTNP